MVTGQKEITERIRSVKELLDELKEYPKGQDTAKLAVQIYHTIEGHYIEPSWYHRETMTGVK